MGRSDEFAFIWILHPKRVLRMYTISRGWAVADVLVAGHVDRPWPFELTAYSPDYV